jgi:hypothetical protein
MKGSILHSVAQSGDEESGRWLMEVAADPNESLVLRGMALFWVGQSREMSVEEMTGLYERTPERELKEQIIFSATQRHDEEVVGWLLDIARNEKDPELRKTVIFWLSQSDDPRVAEFMLELIEGGAE